MGFPIRKSPDHRLLASSRGLSQLTTSFIACLRQGIHTHALSSLTIKSTSNTKCTDVILALGFHFDSLCLRAARLMEAALLVIQIMPVKYSIVKDQISSVQRKKSKIILLSRSRRTTFGFLILVGLGRVELPTSPLSGVRSSQLSYRPASGLATPHAGGAGRDRTGDLLNANQALSQLSYSPQT